MLPNPCEQEVIVVVVLTCEVCGHPIGDPSRVEIDGAILQVCQSCAKRGRPLASTLPRVRPVRSRPFGKRGLVEPELEVDPEYNSIVRLARERLGLTQETLGRAINVKPSVISHVETKKMKPDLVLARTLMHYLKVELLVSSSDLESTQS
jgi:putative transcription factor